MGGGNSKRDPPTVMVEHFNKERMLGIGGFGKVHAVVKKVGHDKDKWYAMKTLDKKALRKSNLLAEIKNEFGLLKDLNFIFTCNLFYCFQDDVSVYFVIDIALGGDLRYHLNKAKGKRFSESRSMFYTAQLILALEHMHSKNCLHRDIKPDNLLMLKSGYIKLTDFGVSQRILPDVSKGKCEEFAGTPGYMAPELYTKNHAHNNTAEWFSVGVVVHEFLLSVRPYNEDKYKFTGATRRENRRSSRGVRVSQTGADRNSITRERVSPKELLKLQPTVMGSEELKAALGGKSISKGAINFLCRTLTKLPKQRIGFGSEKADAIKSHSWFEEAGFLWDQVLTQTFPVEHIPDTSEANVECNDHEMADFLEMSKMDLRRPSTVINIDEFSGLWFNYHQDATENKNGEV